ncbi:MAG: multicopper oxidase domain-containing protein [Actinomycetota bacterium]|nr:multicopper oxidase domain-containing protein [Actinomycetota bacterium]
MSERTKALLVWPVAGFFVVIAFGVGVIAEAAFGGRGDVNAAPSSGESTETEGNAVAVELGDLFINPAEISLEPGDASITVRNNGKSQHDLTVTGLAGTKMLDPGAEETIALTGLEAGTYDFICSVPGHADGGMKGTITVAEGDGTETASAGDIDHSAHASMSPQEMLDADAARTALFPAETKGTGGKPLEPMIEADGTKVFELIADEIKWEIEPGVFKQGMAYNGQIPGPTINAELGDKVKIVLTNELDHEPTVLHLHGMILPNAMDGVPALTQDAILPGDSFTYEFTVRNTGSNMYHSHFMADTQVPKGLLGAFVVEDPKDPKVDLDTTMVLNDGPLSFTINGKSFPATAPIVVSKDDLVRIRYMNEGLQIHPMHLHGIPQKVVAKDGHVLDHPYMADTVMVAPGERYDVLVKASEVGAWAFHCHILTHAEGAEGMFGMVTAMIVE